MESIHASREFGLAYITVRDLNGNYQTENLFSYSLN